MSDIKRRLATVQRITSISPITRTNETGEVETADAIMLCRILGWDVVCRRDTGLAVGDLVVFWEIDSCLPDWEMFEEMLRGKPWSPKASRLKTVRFFGQLSQGYARDAAEVLAHATVLNPTAVMPTEVGTDVTELTGTTLYEPPMPTDTALLAGHWVPGVPKTDEERCESAPALVERLRGEPYVITIKMDGQSATYTTDDEGVFWCCSRNWRLRADKAGSYGVLAERYGIEQILRSDGRRLAIQGEAYGENINGNVHGLRGVELAVFDVFVHDERRYLSHHECVEFCKEHGLPHVPVIEIGQRFDYTVDQLRLRSHGTLPNGHLREGIVIRNSTDTGTDRTSFKAVDPLFLLSKKGGR